MLALAVMVLAGCLGKTTDSTAPVDIMSPGKWIPLAPMPTARQEVAVAEVNGRIFVIGGFGSDSEAVATVEVYDPASDRWETRTPLPAPTHHAAAAVTDASSSSAATAADDSARARGEPATSRRGTESGRPAPLRVRAACSGGLGGRLHAIGGSDTAERRARDLRARRPTGRAMVFDADRAIISRPLRSRASLGIGGRVVPGDLPPTPRSPIPRRTAGRLEPAPTGRGGLAAAVLAIASTCSRQRHVHLQRQRDVRSRRQPLDRQTQCAAAPWHRRGGGRPAHLRAGRRNPA